MLDPLRGMPAMHDIKNIALVLEYDGSAFHGWQSQKNAVAVQDAIEGAIEKLTGEKARLAGASRTDAGVHALGQVANFRTASKIPPEKYAFALNTLLSESVSVTSSRQEPLLFHARFSAKGKKYIYRIINRRQPSAVLRDRAWHVPLELNAGLMSYAAAKLVGEHDFRAFMASGSPVNSTVRHIWGIEVKRGAAALECGGDEVLIHIAGNGFLYNMVRIIAGTLVDIGLGRISAECVDTLLSAPDRKNAGQTAPPHGLYLAEVVY